MHGVPFDQDPQEPLPDDRSLGPPELAHVDFSAMKARAIAAARAQPSPVRRVVSVRTKAIIIAGFFAPVLIFLAVGALRPGDRPWALYAGTALGTLLIAAVTAWVVIGRGGQMLGRPRRWLIASITATPLAFLAWKLIWSHVHGFTHAWPERLGLRCLALTLVLALFPLVALAITRRGIEPRHPITLGAAFGVASGAYAAVMVDLWCPVGDPAHLLIGHVLPMGLLGLVGMWIGSKILSVYSN